MSDTIDAVRRELQASGGRVATSTTVTVRYLPIYEGIGGVVGITEELCLIEVDDDGLLVSGGPSEALRLIALKHGRRRYPFLARLLPVRPTTASDCPVCKGAGELYGGFDCGACNGLGWVR